MENQVANIFIDKIKSLPWIDKIAGAVKVIQYESTVEKGKIKKFPAACETTLEECQTGRYKDLVPDSSKRSVLYLEGKGVRPMGLISGSKVKFRASYDLVCWLNMPKLGFTDCSFSAIAIMDLLKKFPKIPFNTGIYQQMNFSFAGQSPKSNDPFSKYSYDEVVKQYLMYPFDYFVLQIDIDFIVDKRCITAATLPPAINCLDK